MKKTAVFYTFLFTLLSFMLHAAPLPADKVFNLSAKRQDPNTVVLVFKIKNGVFLYKDKLSVKGERPLFIAPLRLPKALKKKDSLGNDYPIYRKKLQLPVFITNDKSGKAKLTINYQGCADSGFCYPPMQQTLLVSVDKSKGIEHIELLKPNLKKAKTPTTSKTSNDSHFQTILKTKSLFFIILSFYGFGLLLAFTPCVLPMVPVLSGILVSQHEHITPYKAFSLSLAYVLGMSITYAIAGVLVAAIGQNIQAALQTPLTIGLFSFIFILLALSMFGFYELKLPESWQTRLTLMSRKHHNGATISAAIMGALSTLILSPCVTAPMVGALSFIASSGNTLIGGTSLLAMGLGMGTPLLLIGTSLSKLLPKQGSWMLVVKHGFGIALLGVAIYLLNRILPPTIIMILWASLCIIPAIFFGALNPKPVNNVAIFFKGLGLILFLWGILILVGAAMGNTSPIIPLAINRNLPANASEQPHYQLVYTIDDIKNAISTNKGKPIMLDFYADWCTSCQIMEKGLFKDPTVLKALQHVLWLKADVTANDDKAVKLQKHYGVFAPPTFIFLDKSGKEKARLLGEVDEKKLIKTLKQ